MREYKIASLYVDTLGFYPSSLGQASLFLVLTSSRPGLARQSHFEGCRRITIGCGMPNLSSHLKWLQTLRCQHFFFFFFFMKNVTCFFSIFLVASQLCGFLKVTFSFFDNPPRRRHESTTLLCHWSNWRLISLDPRQRRG